MYYEISRALKLSGQLTRAQISSSHFAEEPRIGVHTLRRGSRPLKLSEAEYLLCEKDIKKGLQSQSIVVTAKEDDGTKIWTLIQFSPGGFNTLPAAAGKAVEAEVQKDLDSGKETLESLQAEVVPPPVVEKRLSFVEQEDRKFLEMVDKAVAETEELKQKFDESLEVATEGKKKGRKAKKENE